jgi:hypothetical protein
VDPLPERVRLVDAPGRLYDVELEVLGWRTEGGEVALICRLLDGSPGTIPARWTDLPLTSPGEPPLGVVASPAGWRALLERGQALSGRRPRRRRASAENGGADVGAALLVAVGGQVPPAAVWETLPPEVQRQVTLKLAQLLARLVEAGRDE